MSAFVYYLFVVLGTVVVLRMVWIVCMWRLKHTEQPWLWGCRCLGPIRVELFKIFDDLEEIDGVSYDALTRILLTINPWCLDDDEIDVLVNAVYRTKRRMGKAVVCHLQTLNHGHRPPPFKLFLLIVDVSEGLVDIQVSDFDMGFLIHQAVVNIPHLATLWKAPFGTARYRWIATYYLKVALADTFLAIILSTDWTASVVPERWFRRTMSLFDTNSFHGSMHAPYRLSVTATELFGVLLLFTKQTADSNWSCLLCLLEHAHVPPEELAELIYQSKYYLFLDSLATATDMPFMHQCVSKIIAMFPAPVHYKNSALLAENYLL